MITIHKVVEDLSETPICNISVSVPEEEKTLSWRKTNCSACLHLKPMTPFVNWNEAFPDEADDES